jgi:hypothetical protein
MNGQMLSAALSLYRSDDPRETYLAAILVVGTLALVAYRNQSAGSPEPGSIT